MIKCNLCGKEFSDARKMHGHLIRSHNEEYKAAGYDMERLTEGYKRRPPKFSSSLRLLNLNDPAEAAAYDDGYRYIDGAGELYKEKEV